MDSQQELDSVLTGAISERNIDIFVADKLKEYGLESSASTFTKQLQIRWELNNPTGLWWPTQSAIATDIAGDFFNLGNGEWMYVGL